MGNALNLEEQRSACDPTTAGQRLREALPPLNLNEQQNVSYTDADLLIQALAKQDGHLDMSTVLEMPFFGWGYTRSLLFGCCYSETDILARAQHPQWVTTQDLLYYHRLPHPFPVWVNYPGVGAASATHFQVVYAASRPIVYLVVQALLPFGGVEYSAYRDGQSYRVLSEWCARMPAAVASIQDGYVSVLFANGKASSIELYRFVDPRGTCWDQSLRVARAALLRDWPNLAGTLVGYRGAPLFCEPGDDEGDGGDGAYGGGGGSGSTTRVSVGISQ